MCIGEGSDESVAEPHSAAATPSVVVSLDAPRVCAGQKCPFEAFVESRSHVTAHNNTQQQQLLRPSFPSDLTLESMRD